MQSVQLPREFSGPGLIDIQINGYAGVDFNDAPENLNAEGFHKARLAMRKRGVVAALPTFITDAPDVMLQRVRRWKQIVDADAELAAFFPKLHIEGPFISPHTGPRGAHPQEFCTSFATHPEFVDQLRRASDDRIGVLTFAPETSGAAELAERCVKSGICPAIGHSCATAEQIRHVADAGAKLCTHLGNGSHQQLPRLDNYIQAQLAEDRLFASFIADGHHMPFTTLKNFIRAKTIHRTILVTDAMTAAELEPGIHRFRGEEVEVSPEGRASKPHEENLAGSVLTLDKAVINVATHCDVSMENAWLMASTQPAELVGLHRPAEISVRISDDGFQLI